MDKGFLFLRYIILTIMVRLDKISLAWKEIHIRSLDGFTR